MRVSYNFFHTHTLFSRYLDYQFSSNMQITEESKDLKSKPTHTAIIAPTSLTQLDTTTAAREGLEVPMPDLEEQVESGCLCCQSKGRAATDRLHFVRKVYLLLLMQVFLTAVWLVLVLVISPLRHFIIALWPLALCMFGASLLSLLVLLCIPRLHRRVPWNYILLLLFVSANSDVEWSLYPVLAFRLLSA